MESPSELVARWAARLSLDAAACAEVGSSFKFEVSGERGGVWLFDCRQGFLLREGRLAEEDAADCTVALSDEDFSLLGSGALNPQTAYLTGRLRLSGDFGAALKLYRFFG